jgi:hypothetical protein
MFTQVGEMKLTCKLCDILADIKKIASSLFWTRQPTFSEIASNFKVQTSFQTMLGVLFFPKTHP